MNATAKDRECLTEESLCKHELPSTGWFRDALSFLTSLIFRPHPAGPPNPKPAGKRDTPQVKAREVQAINVLSRAVPDPRRFHTAASGLERKRFLEAHAPITSQHPNGSNQGLWPRNQNQTERPSK
jgi:hypothetical protein